MSRGVLAGEPPCPVQVMPPAGRREMAVQLLAAWTARMVIGASRGGCDDGDDVAVGPL